MSLSITWLGHAGLRYEGEKVVYVDPWEVTETHDADVVLVTHDHYDHCIPEDIEKVSKAGTIIVTTADCAAKIKGDVKTVKPGDTLEVNGIQVEAVPAYNKDKNFHPKANNWVGFIFTLNGRRIYQSGDTDKIDEMKDVNADIAVLPVGGTYTMTAEEAAAAVAMIEPKLCIPMHHSKIVGDSSDAKRFSELIKVKTLMLEPLQTTSID